MDANIFDLALPGNRLVFKNILLLGFLHTYVQLDFPSVRNWDVVGMSS